jgi:hypothetical protein
VKVTWLVEPVVAGLKAAVTPLGRPLAVRLTLALNPFCPSTEIVLPGLLCPSRTVKELDEEERLKPGTGMFTTIDPELVIAPEVPVTVTE